MIEAWFDGACWPNPGGHSACGGVIKRDGKVIHEISDYLGAGHTSNNSAEYAGIVQVMDWLHQNKITEDVIIYGDSNMVINQMSGVWKVRTKGKPKIYMSNHALAIQLRALLPNVRYRWIPREQNTEADALSTQPLYKRGYREVHSRRDLERTELDAAFEHAISK